MKALHASDVTQWAANFLKDLKRSASGAQANRREKEGAA
jgi:hypothetical protein